MLKAFLIAMDVLQQEIILLTKKALKIKGYSKQDLKFKDISNDSTYIQELLRG